MRTNGRAGRQTDRHDEANSRFRNFANAPKNNKKQRALAVANHYHYPEAKSGETVSCRIVWPSARPSLRIRILH